MLFLCWLEIIHQTWDPVYHPASRHGKYFRCSWFCEFDIPVSLFFRGVTRLYTDSLIIISIACTTDGTKLLVKSICETVLKFLFWVPTCEPGFDYDWPVKKPLSKANITVKRNSKCISSNLLSLLVAQNKDIGTVSQMLLTGVRLPLPH